MADIFDREFDPAAACKTGSSFVLRQNPNGTHECLLDGQPIKMLKKLKLKLELDADDLVPHLTLTVLPASIELCVHDVQLSVEELNLDRQAQIAAAIRDYQNEFAK